METPRRAIAVEAAAACGQRGATNASAVDDNRDAAAAMRKKTVDVVVVNLRHGTFIIIIVVAVLGADRIRVRCELCGTTTIQNETKLLYPIIPVQEE